jgi:hypothetical protein
MRRRIGLRSFNQLADFPFAILLDVNCGIKRTIGFTIFRGDGG